MQKKLLMVAKCRRRGKGPAAYIGDLISYLKKYGGQQFEIDLLVTLLNSGYTKDDFEADNVILPKVGVVSHLILKIPRIRAWYWNRIVQKTYSSTINSRDYDWIVFHAIPHDISYLVKLAKNTKAKILLYPWGSEIMRVADSTLESFRFAFDNMDFVRGDGSMLVEKLEKFYHIPHSKFVNLVYGSKVIDCIEKYRGKLSKDELAVRIGINTASYYIVCGYNRYKGQNHETMISQLAMVKDFLPHGYTLVFPLTYGDGPNDQYLRNLCKKSGLEAQFLTEYLTDEQMACLHLVTDLFIHIQQTDLANSYMIESVFANTNIISGGWLSYVDLEKGGKPYYTTEVPDQLHVVVRDFLNGKLPKRVAGKAVSEEIRKESWDFSIKGWADFFKN